MFLTKNKQQTFILTSFLVFILFFIKPIQAEILGITGDINRDGSTNIQDIVALISKVLNDDGSTSNNYITPSLEIINGGVKVVDSWLSSGGRNKSSFRNHHYVFDVTQEGNVTLNIGSSVNSYLFLINSLGFTVAETSSNTININLSPDTYTIIAATYGTGEKSNYTLKMLGAITNIKKINSLHTEKIGNWTSSGGRFNNSFRNDHYLFDVTVDSYIDITIESTVFNYLYLINSLGFIVAEVSGNHLIASVPIDSYRLVVATYYAGEKSNYALNLVGQYSNFREKSSNIFESIGSWTSSGGRDRQSTLNPSYSFNISEESLVDITIVSSISNYLYLVNNIDNVVKEISGNRLTALVPAGQYKLVAATYYENQSSNFDLKIYGQIDNFIQN